MTSLVTRQAERLRPWVPPPFPFSGFPWKWHLVRLFRQASPSASPQASPQDSPEASPRPAPQTSRAALQSSPRVPAANLPQAFPPASLSPHPPLQGWWPPHGITARPPWNHPT
ncbi:hypothetical protein BC829DRAFT_409515 [Chytridium lagenaria]|nr:hypothetical protein BC829DRAFT_409515 [Chytridium lagenaria]